MLGSTMEAGLKAAIVGLLAWLVGLPAAFTVLFGMQVLDFAAGVISAGTRGKAESSQALKGWRKKGFCWIVILMVLLLQHAIGPGLPVVVAGMTPAEVVAVGFIGGEAISIVEHAARLGVPMPSWLVDALQKVKTEADGDETE